MLDAVRIAGRFVGQKLLGWISARAEEPNAPNRRRLVEEFCRRANWVDRKGRLCVSSANVALGRLEQQGHVRLPPPEPRAPRQRPRQLRDDGLPLPELPELPQRADQIEGLEVQLLDGAQDPDHALWNRLIIREHPLKAAPLVGTQLRYLIRCQWGVLGAIGFGPAAFHLECRDLWIGWDPAAQAANRPRVIGLSRFLLRPGLHCANLASRCHRRLLERVAADWCQRYGVEPLLVETYVDRSTHSGVSLSAANWRRLGSSSGRGRSSPSDKVRPLSPKDVWVYPLHPKARERLRRFELLEPLVPRSLFHHRPASDHWVKEELDGLTLGDTRLEARATEVLAARWAHPNRSFAASFAGAAALKAAFRFIATSRSDMTFQALLAPHHQQSARRLAAESVVVLAQDTTTLSYNTLHQTQGLGRVGDGRHPGRGLFLHSLHAFRTDRIALGCLWAKLWTREAESDTDQRDEQSVAAKESGRWLEAYQAARRVAQRAPNTHLVVCGDRESDLFELYDQAEDAPKNLHFLVRARHDRPLSSGAKLWDALQELPAGGRMKVRVPRSTQRAARTATLELRWAEVELAPPQVALKKSWKPLKVYAVLAREPDPPPGVEPIEWMLLTDWPVNSLKTARRMVCWYGLRWGIECWHQVLKDLCGVETRQMKSRQALERALALDMIVAWRAQMLCRLGKESPNLPAELYYSQAELTVLEILKKKPRTRPSSRRRQARPRLHRATPRAQPRRHPAPLS